MGYISSVLANYRKVRSTWYTWISPLKSGQKQARKDGIEWHTKKCYNGIVKN